MPYSQSLASQFEQLRSTQLSGVPSELVQSGQGALIVLQDELQSGRQTVNQALEPFFNATTAFGQAYRGSVDTSMLAGAARGVLDVITAPLGLFSSGFVSVSGTLHLHCLLLYC
jgi:hypothetical protein